MPGPITHPASQPLDHLVMRGARDAPALILRDGTLTYGETEQRVARLAARLASRMEPGGRVASWAGKGELTCLLPLAAARAGLVHVPINPLLKRAQAAHILADSGAALLLANTARLDSLAAEDVPAGCGLSETGAFLEEARTTTTELPASGAAPHSLAAILYTSGSTGAPKGVALSHANLWLGAESVATYLQLAPDDVTLAVLPLAFDYGQNQLLSTWYAGGCVAPLDYLAPRDVVRACARNHVTTLAGVPPLWTDLIEVDWPAEAVASLRRMTNSGGALTLRLVEAMRRRFPAVDLVPMYGLTEAFRSTYLPPHLVDTHPTSIGHAIPHAEVLVVNDGGEPATDGEEGELVHCGPLVAQGYWRDPGRSAERFRPAPAWSSYGGVAVWSGDRVRRQDGLLYFEGRRDAMIKTSGYRVSPQEVEDAAMGSGLVAECVAVGITDERLGQVIHLIARPARGRDADSGALQAHLARALPTFMQPGRIHWRAALPRNASGKLDRARLVHELAAAVNA